MDNDPLSETHGRCEIQVTEVYLPLYSVIDQHEKEDEQVQGWSTRLLLGYSLKPVH